MGEARDKGIEINTKELSSILSVPVIETDCLNGKGIEQLAKKCEEVMAGKVRFAYRKAKYDDHIESLLNELESFTGNKREVIMDLLEGSPTYWSQIRRKGRIRNIIRRYEKFHNIATDISKDRHGRASLIAEKVTRIGEKKEIKWREKLSRLAIEPKTGIPILIAILALMFYILFTIGAKFEEILISSFQTYIVPIFSFFINLIPIDIINKL